MGTVAHLSKRVLEGTSRFTDCIRLFEGNIYESSTWSWYLKVAETVMVENLKRVRSVMENLKRVRRKK